MARRPKDPFDDDFDPETAEALDCLVDALPPMALGGDLESALFARLPGCRFERYADQVAHLLDVGRERAIELLEAVDVAASWSSGLIPEMTLFHVDGGPAVAHAVTGFARLEAGALFPEHLHLGEELCLVLQGYFTDGATGREYGPGDLAIAAKGSAHEMHVLDGGVGLLYLVVIQQGIEIDGVPLLYDDPNL